MNKLKRFFTHKTNLGRFVFIAVFIAMCFSFNLHNTLFGRPQSIHIWRQTNSLSIALNYYEHGNSLFEPQIHNQFCDDGMSGKSAGEFPIIYFGVAKLWKVFGVHEWIFRFVLLLILFFGLFALFETCFYFLKNQFWSGFVSLILFTSPMVVFYGINFLPDGTSLVLMFIGWFFVLRYHQLRKTYWLWIGAFFFTLSLSIKITSGISLIAFLAWIAFELIFRKKKDQILGYGIMQIMPYLVVIALTMAWYLYVVYYNNLHKGDYSEHTILPIWQMTSEKFSIIKDQVSKIFFKQYMNPYMQYLTIILWIGLIARFRKNPFLLNWGLLLLPLGVFSILMLWFQVLHGHDYYLIVLLIAFAFIWMALFYALKNYKWMRHPLMYGLLIAIFAYNVYSCRKELKNRYEGWMNGWFVNNIEAVGELDPLLNQLQIGKNDRVISIPDPSVVVSLYFMNRPGYTDFGSDFNQEEGFRKRIGQGAKYLIINDTTILDKPVVKAFAEHYIGKYRNVKIFDLRPYATQTTKE